MKTPRAAGAALRRVNERPTRDFSQAVRLYSRLATHYVSRNDLEGESSAYHQLGTIAQQERDFAQARDWYRKSLEIEKKQGNLHGEAITYHQLGTIAQKEKDFTGARGCYLKSLAIREQQGDLHGAASAYGDLGIMEGLQGNFIEAGRWLVQSVSSFTSARDKQGAMRNTRNFLIFHQRATLEDKQKLEAIWRDANLGPFPTPQGNQK